MCHCSCISPALAGPCFIAPFPHYHLYMLGNLISGLSNSCPLPFRASFISFFMNCSESPPAPGPDFGSCSNSPILLLLIPHWYWKFTLILDIVEQYKSNPAGLNSNEGMCDYLLTENIFQLLDYDLNEIKGVYSQCKHTTLPLCFTHFIFCFYFFHVCYCWQVISLCHQRFPVTIKWKSWFRRSLRFLSFCNAMFLMIKSLDFKNTLVLRLVKV